MRRLVSLGLSVLCAAVGTWFAPTAAAASGLPPVYATQVIGHSARGRPIVAYHLGTPGAAIRAVIVGQMHGDEKAGVRIAQTIIASRPVQGVDLWVIPTMNPDGNAAGTRQNAHGVDLNRNWPNRWTALSWPFYSGRAPLSEPETRAMYRFLKRVKPTRLISIHQPLDGVDSTDGGARDRRFQHRLATRLELPTKAFTCGGACLGTMTGWLTAHQSGAAITVELPQHPSRQLLARAPGAILSSLGARADTVSAHNPVVGISDVVLADQSITLVGIAGDRDKGTAASQIEITVDDLVVYAGTAAVQRDSASAARHLVGSRHGFRVTLAVESGDHVVCVSTRNVRWGTVDGRRQCVTAVVPAIRELA